ncbi:MAG: hypothetical protein CMQ41_11930 [Gammaproteobacteria bacterium]|nr:hypothetical protein [Gammaproteobacteria bacterium]|tara:strand:- start:160 stop:1383 length:1224 start_codon:yes stop_codon:yes gene_type:complete
MTISNPIRILIGLILGLLLGIIYSSTNNEFMTFLPGFVTPIGVLWVNAIRMIVIPLLMALLITSIVGRGASVEVAQLGGKTISLFLLLVFFSAMFAYTTVPPLLGFINIDPSASASLIESTDYDTIGINELPTLSDWLVSLIPTNPFAAAVDEAILPLLIFTGLFSMALLRIEKKEREHIVAFFGAIKSSMFVLIGWVMLLAPIGIFALVFPLAANLGISAITMLGSFIVIVCSLISVLMMLLYPLVVTLTDIPLIKFTKTIAPAQAIGFCTRSSLASLPATYAAAAGLGIPEKVTGIVFPFAVTLFKYASPLARTAGTYFVAFLFGIDLSVLELLAIALAIGLLSFYSPGIPSGGLLIMTPVYLSFDLPVEGIGILIAIDLIVDMFLTMANVTANIASSALLAKRF